MDNTKRVVLIGGTFNPITNAHIQMGVTAQKIYPDASIFYVPDSLKFISQWKELSDMEPFTDSYRINMLEQAVRPYGFQISFVEVNGETNGTTYELVNVFKKSFDEVIICMGTDKLSEIEHWYKAEELFTKVKVLLFRRGYDSLQNYSNNKFVNKYYGIFREVNINLPFVSSTTIREAYKENELESIKEQVPDIVYNTLRKIKHMECDFYE